MSNTIVQKGKGHREEGVLTTVASPGMIVERTTGNSFGQLASSQANFLKGIAGFKIVEEDALQGKSVDDASAIGDMVPIYNGLEGDHVMVLVKDGEVIIDGDQLVPEGGGSGLWVKAAGTEASFSVNALEAVSPSGKNLLCSAEIIQV